MKQYISKGIFYPRIFQKNKDTLVKFSPVLPEAWNLLQTKNLNFVNTPQKIEHLTEEEKVKFPYTSSKIEIPYLRNYESLDDETITKHFDTEKILQLTKYNLSLLKKLHDEKIYHTDIHSKNIMIDKNLNLIFIDLDAMIIESYISEENMYFEDEISTEEKQEKSKITDKIDMLNVYLWYLKYGTFKEQFGEAPTISSDYYFEDIIEELLKQGYESPKLLSRK